MASRLIAVGACVSASGVNDRSLVFMAAATDAAQRLLHNDMGLVHKDVFDALTEAVGQDVSFHGAPAQLVRPTASWRAVQYLRVNVPAPDAVRLTGAVAIFADYFQSESELPVVRATLDRLIQLPEITKLFTRIHEIGQQ